VHRYRTSETATVGAGVVRVVLCLFVPRFLFPSASGKIVFPIILQTLKLITSPVQHAVQSIRAQCRENHARVVVVAFLASSHRSSWSPRARARATRTPPRHVVYVNYYYYYYDYFFKCISLPLRPVGTRYGATTRIVIRRRRRRHSRRRMARDRYSQSRAAAAVARALKTADGFNMTVTIK